MRSQRLSRLDRPSEQLGDVVAQPAGALDLLPAVPACAVRLRAVGPFGRGGTDRHGERGEVGAGRRHRQQSVMDAAPAGPAAVTAVVVRVGAGRFEDDAGDELKATKAETVLQAVV